jgi:hypothetical protein
VKRNPVNLKRTSLYGVLFLVVLAIRSALGPTPPTAPPAPDTGTSVEEASASRLSEVMLRTSGVVQRTLADDNEGSRHQRFILELPSGATVLVAHNIDLAPRVPLTAGDAVAIHGQYEWNERGGVLHWTHRDPGGRHVGGWIEHQGKRYE